MNSTRLLSFSQAAERLGMDRRTVSQMVGLRQLPAVWVGGRRRVSERVIEEYVHGRDACDVGVMTAFALYEALTTTEEGRAIMAQLQRVLAGAHEASHVTGEDGR